MSQLPPNPRRINRKRREPLIPSWAVGMLVALFLVATLLVGYLVFVSVRDFVAGWQITGPASSPALGQATPAPGGNTSPVSSGAAPNPLIPKKWTGTDRVTILMLGIDRRAGDTDTTAFRSDSMMILSVDPVAQSGFLFSIPRDLWVEIPNYGNAKITEANFKGDAYKYPGGGPALAVKTVEHNLGVNVNHYVRIDFTAFETLIDAIGGIDINNPTDINDPEYPDGAYGYEPFYLSAGQHHLNGHDALRYARTRHDSSDIARAERQQQVVMTVRDKVLSLNMLPQLMLQGPALYQKLNESVQTDLTLDQIASLALLAKDIPRSRITQAVLDYHYVLDYTTPDDQQVLVPIRDKIRDLIGQLYTASAPLTPGVAGADDPAQRQAEAARVEVLNGAGVQGLAGATADWLKAQGVNVVRVDTADRTDYTNSVIMDYTGKPATTRWLARLFNVTNIVNGSDPNSTVDVRVIVGADWKVPQGATP